MSERGELTPLAERAKQRLDELGLTPITAATRAGLQRDTFRNMFRGDALPRADTLTELCLVLGVSADWLLFGDGEEAPPAAPACAAATPRISTATSVTDNRVTLDIKANVSMGVAAQILALIEGDRP